MEGRPGLLVNNLSSVQCNKVWRVGQGACSGHVPRHVLGRHVPQYVLKHVLRYMPDKHVLEQNRTA